MSLDEQAKKMGQYFEQKDPFYELPQADQDAINRAVAEAALQLRGKEVKMPRPIYPLADDAFNHLPEADRMELDRMVYEAAARIQREQALTAGRSGCLAGIFRLLGI